MKQPNSYISGDTLASLIKAAEKQFLTQATIPAAVMLFGALMLFLDGHNAFGLAVVMFALVSLGISYFVSTWGYIAARTTYHTFVVELVNISGHIKHETVVIENYNNIEHAARIAEILNPDYRAITTTKEGYKDDSISANVEE